MKQQTYLLLLFTIIGTAKCHGYGVKGAFSKSYSSSSASASSSAFSSSYSSNPLDATNNVDNSGSSAFSAAFANADAAKAGSGAFAGAGAGAGAYSGSLSGAGAGAGSHQGSAGYNLKPGQIPVIPVTVGSGAVSFSGGNHGLVGGKTASNSNCGANGGCGLNNANANAGNVNIGHNKVDGNAAAGYSGAEGNSIKYVNDFKIPDEYSPKYQGNNKPQFPGPQGSIYDYKPAPAGGGGPPTWSQSTPQVLPINPVHTGSNNANAGVNSGVNSGVHSSGVDVAFKPGQCKSCKGPFPGPKGNINDYKPVDVEGGKVSKPELEQPVVDSYPPLIRPIDTNKFPGSPGSIYDSKPVSPGPYNENTHYKPSNQEHHLSKPGAAANSVIGKLPGPTGNIHTPYSAAGKDQVPVAVPVPNYNNKPGYPDCTHGECDEYGGRLGCHGDDCFGPGKKPSYVHAGSNAAAQANHNSGNIGIDYNKPNKPDCSSGQCNIDGAYYPEKPLTGTYGKVCSGSQCLNPSINEPTPDVIDNKPPGHDYNVDIRVKPDNLDVYQPETPKKPNLPVHGNQQTVYSNANANSNNNDYQTETNPNPNNIPVEVELPPHQQHTTNTQPKPNDEVSRDFLLPGNKPYHRPHIPPHHSKPTHQDSPKPTEHNKDEPEQIPGSPYYKCTGESCKLPKPQPSIPVSIDQSQQIPVPIQPAPHQHTSVSPQPHPQIPVLIQPAPHQHTPVSPQSHQSIPVTIESAQPIPVPVQPSSGNTYYKCTGESCELPKPVASDCVGSSCEKVYYTCSGSSCPKSPSTGCQGSQCGAGGRDRLYPHSTNDKVPVSVDIPNYNDKVPTGGPVLIDIPDYNDKVPSESPVSGGYQNGAHSGAHSNANDYKQQGFVSGQPCASGKCTFGNQNQHLPCTTGNCNSGSNADSQGFVAATVVKQSDGQDIPLVNVHYSGPGPYAFGNNHNQQNGYSVSGSGSGSGSGSVPCSTGNCAQSGNLCGNGNCGHGINSVNFGQHSGAHSGVKGGCKHGGCVYAPGNTHSSNGAVASAGALSGSYSGSGVGDLTVGFNALKDLLNQNIKSNAFGGAGSYSSSGSFAHGGAGASSFGHSSAYSGAYSSAGSTSY